jgi:hypothetical protein
MRAMDDDTDAVTERIWAQGEKKDDYAPLSIDKFLVQRSMKSRLPITRRLKEAKNRVRRPMEVGYHEVQRVRRAQPGLIADDFQCLEDKAKAAHKALDKLLHHLEPKAKEPADLALPILTVQAGLQKGTPRALHKMSEDDALTLWNAREIIKRFAQAAARKEARVRQGRQNPGNPEHRIFAKTLAEMWIFLTGKRPGSNPAHDRNPFLRFVAAAWIDVFGHDENSEDPTFVGALAALSFSDYQISQITSKGPDWI